MKRTILALAIAALSVAAYASPPPGGGPPTPIDVNVSNVPLPTWLAQPSSMSGGEEQEQELVSCWAETTDTAFVGCQKTLPPSVKIWASVIEAKTDSVGNNCHVRFFVTKGGITQYTLGTLAAGPGWSGNFQTYPVLIETPPAPQEGGEIWELHIVVRRDNTNEYCHVLAAINTLP
jgi:hypothetical protein